MLRRQLGKLAGSLVALISASVVWSQTATPIKLVVLSLIHI